MDAAWQSAASAHFHGRALLAFQRTPDDRSILVVCGRSNEIVVIDAQTLEPVKRIADSQLPWGIVTYPKAAGSVDRVE